MKDTYLLEMTGSESLTYEEEVTMQQSWRDDPNKCTFIILKSSLSVSQEDEGQQEDESQPTIINVTDHLDSMVGDVNLFLSEIDDDDEEEYEYGQQQHQQEEEEQTNTPVIKKKKIQAEIDIMIAEKDYQRKGLGREATCVMLLYGLDKLNVSRYFCKIKETNHKSIEMFKSIGFIQCAYAKCFNEIEFELRFDDDDTNSDNNNAIETNNNTNDKLILLKKYGKYKVLSCPL